MAVARSLALLMIVLLLGGAGPVPVAGDYMLVGMREAAGGLRLGDDGRFRYGFSHGALDEQAEGRWRREGNLVLLTTDPAPRPPAWSLVLAEPGAPKLFALILEDPSGRPIPNIEVEVRMKDGSVETGMTQSEWLEADLDGKLPVAVAFRIPVFDVASPSFPLHVTKAQRYRFRLDPNDLGVRDFRDWPLEVRGDLLAPPDAPDGQGFRRMEVRD